ncbi:related to RVS167 protein (reduced viability upon starvation) [Rhynchosporium agropyri]|uniref:Related to RVS167 protein (Reduced viability upon starvation) n=1 Tax=Rhynchosporium agropyri TaxID=914238 RepID=A0A1E1LJ10_9HELO|nr:related to RVS167 protein (reduced viability upon starvation) [Rhynchosporium agropyri]
MNSLHRQFGKLTHKGAGDKASVSVLLNDYEDADKVLTKMIEASKAWRDAWVSILGINVSATTLFEELYNPIAGAGDGHGRDPVMTARAQLDRTSKLKDVFTDLKTDLLEEVNMMESRVIKPATEAKDHIQPIRKIIKKRDNKRLDWERYIDKVNNYQRKVKRTDRENAALVKAEQELAQAAEDFKIADESLRETLPPIIQAAFSILPHLLAVHIMIQNTLLAQYYTALHNYCEDTGFASPPPPMGEVISTWNNDFKPTQMSIEDIPVLAHGRAIHQPMTPGDDGGRKPTTTVTGLNVRNGLMNRKPSTQGLNSQSVSPHPEKRVTRIPSSNHVPKFTPQPTPSPPPESSLAIYSPPTPGPDYSSHLTPQSSYSSHSPAGPSMDYFQRSSTNSSNSSALQVQKKKPPPPPPKRIGSQNLAVYAVALYDFEGQNQGDLTFSEGDQIKVTKKTGSVDDWWEGELRGMRGSFPANYCKLA